MNQTPTPYEVVEGQFMASGQLTMGYVMGVRYVADDGRTIDAIIFAATRDELWTTVNQFKSDRTFFGQGRRDRCVLAGESQFALMPPLPVPEVKDATPEDWADATRPGALG